MWRFGSETLTEPERDSTESRSVYSPGLEQRVGRGRGGGGRRGKQVRWARLLSTTRSVHLLLLGQFGGVHKVSSVEDDDGRSDRAGRAPE